MFQPTAIWFQDVLGFSTFGGCKCGRRSLVSLHPSTPDHPLVCIRFAHLSEASCSHHTLHCLQPHGYPRTLRHSVFALQDPLAFHGMRQNFGRNIPRNQERQLVRRAPTHPPIPPCCANLTPPSAAASLPHIRVWYDGHLYVSENNRRLFVFKRLESEVLARILRISPSTLNTRIRACCTPCPCASSASKR